MIHDQSLPMFLWAEASKTSVYVQNRCPHKIVKNMTPEEAFTGVKPEVGQLQIFGWSSLHTSAQGEKDKFRTFRQEGNFRGIHESSKAYRIYIPGSR